KEKANLVTNMRLKTFSDYVKEQTGITVIKETEQVPESLDEVDLHMQMNFKLSTEVAMEEFLKYVFVNNNDKELKRKIYRDLIVCKKGISKCHINEDDDIEIRYVDPVNFVSSYSVKDDYSDIRFAGEIIYMDISELRRQSSGKFSEEDLFNIARMHHGKNGNPKWPFSSTYQSYYAEHGMD